MSLDDYIESHSSPEDDYLRSLRRATYIHIARPHMVSGHVEGLLLRMLMQMIRPRTVVEIGTFTGYSAIAMASGLTDGAHIYTFDVNDELEHFTRRYISGSAFAQRITYTVGDALTLLPQLAGKMGERPFDVFFLDGNKREYAAYYHLAKQYLAPGGYILADNTLWDGHVIDPAYDRDSQTLGIREFNDLVAADEDAEKVVIPVRDGLTIIRLKDK